jgi:hypothetical protein
MSTAYDIFFNPDGSYKTSGQYHAEAESTGLASCGHPADDDGECSCSYWPDERAPIEA